LPGKINPTSKISRAINAATIRTHPYYEGKLKENVSVAVFARCRV